MSKLMSRPALVAASALFAPALIRQRTRDNSMFTFDAATRDSTGAFLRSELDRLDNRPYAPLVAVTWGRDIDVRTDVTIADESSSFLNSTFAAAGGLEPGGKAWISKEANVIPGVAIDVGRTIYPLNLWGMELSYTLPELATSQALGRPIDVDKYTAIQTKYQMDIDEQVYIGDAKLGISGLLNNQSITPSAVASGVGGTLWSLKTPTEMLADVNTLITAAWTASAFAYAPTHLLLPPVAYSRLTSQLISSAGSNNILQFLRENSLSNSINGTPLIIAPVKWLTARATNGTNDRMIVYRKAEEFVRIPMTALQRTPVENRSLYQVTTYWGKLGQVEFPRLETIAYMDGL